VRYECTASQQPRDRLGFTDLERNDGMRATPVVFVALGPREEMALAFGERVHGLAAKARGLEQHPERDVTQLVLAGARHTRREREPAVGADHGHHSVGKDRHEGGMARDGTRRCGTGHDCERT
jgi:hypothetical protein